MTITSSVSGTVVTINATNDENSIDVLVRREEPPPPPAGITLVGSGAVSAIAGANVTLTMPPLQVGDRIYVWGAHWLRAGDGLGPLAAHGFTTVVDRVVGSVWRAGMWMKIADGTETSVVCAGSGNAADGASYGFYVLRAADIFDVNVAVIDGTTGQPNCPAVITVTDKAWVLALATANLADTDVQPPAGYGNFVASTANASTNDIGVWGATKEVTPAGAEDPAVWATITATSRWEAITAAVRPQ